ncbi:MAG: hypothetical protein IPO66_20225 [Rhodanobacteraceae bacterium]|nr:hypothetical protein [Rhodanobacteraceae bacterium]
MAAFGPAMTPAASPGELQAPARHVQVGAASVDLATNTVSRADSEPLRLSPKAAQGCWRCCCMAIGRCIANS